mgnify:CR=1 FL=1
MTNHASLSSYLRVPIYISRLLAQKIIQIQLKIFWKKSKQDDGKKNWLVTGEDIDLLTVLYMNF